MSESVNLVLKTTQISNSSTVGDYYNLTIQNNIGIVAQNRSSFTWFNISLKTLLGDMYDKYERFNIALNFIAGSATGGSNGNQNDRVLTVKMSGLPWTSSYDVATNSHTGKVILTSVQVPTAAGSAWVNNSFTENYFTFTKQDLCNISIDLHTVLNDTYYSVGGNSYMLGHCTFSFNIYGIEEYKTIGQTSDNNANMHRLAFGEKEKKIF
jgi:hypothetical protein